MNKVDKYTILGSLLGLSAGGLGGYFASKKNKWRNAALAALAGALGGGTVGRMGYGLNDYMDKSRKARILPPGEKARPGRLYFVSHPKNAINVSKTGIPFVDAASSGVMKATGWDGNMDIGHAGLVTVDPEGHAVRYDYGMYADDPTTMERGGVLTKEFNVPKGLSEKALAKLLQEKSRQWGDTIDIYGTDVPDIGVVKRYLDQLKNPQSDGFSPIPGGYSCGSVANKIFNASRNSWLGYLLDALRGGFPSANAPSYGTSHERYESGQ